MTYTAARQFVSSFARSLARSLVRVVGAPDYDRYIEHMRRAHPDRRVLSRDEFCAERLEARYSRPGARCC